MQGLKRKYLFGNFTEWAGMAVPCLCGPQESLAGIQKIFLFWVPINHQKDWKAKLERDHFLKVQYGKITVWWMEPAAERNKKSMYQVPIQYTYTTY